jgi:AraC-like DNA-binding protein
MKGSGALSFHFIRQFEAVFGLTPHQFRIQTRLDAAKHLLAMGHHSVTDIAGEFARLTAKGVALTPAAT